MENNDFRHMFRLTPETLLPAAPSWIKTASAVVSATIIMVSAIPLFIF